MMVKNQLLKKFNWIIELRSWVYPVTLIFMFDLFPNQRQQKKPRFKIAAFLFGSITFSIGENIINTIFLLLGKIKRTFLSFYNTIKATKLYWKKC